MKNMLVSPSPHVHSPLSTKRLMLDVVIALLPATVVSVLFYGWSELMLVGVSIAACLLIEWVVTRFLLGQKCTLGDFSAVVTGLLLALNVPPTCPWWVMVIGAIFAIGVVKMTFGGLGQNMFNPAIAARVFLLISFPAVMTDWTVPAGFIQATDAVSGATLLGVFAEGGVEKLAGVNYLQTLFLNVGGSAGEISACALLVGFVYLLCRKVIKPWITLSIWGSIAVLALVFWLASPEKYPDPVFNLLTGGVLLGSIFMATDYVTSPMSTWGGVVYGAGIGLLTILIRYFGSYPEGVSFAILIMNAFVPLINKAFHQRKFGRA